MWKRKEIGNEKVVYVVESTMAGAYVVKGTAIRGEGALYFLSYSLNMLADC